jgi:integrase
MGAGPDGRPERRHVSARTQSAVTAKVKKLEKDRDAGAVTSTGRTTLVAYLGEWIARKERLRAVRPNTIDGYRNDEAHVGVAIRKVRLDRLGLAHIEYLWSYLIHRDLTIGHCRRTLNAALNDAVRRGLIPRNPVKAADTPRDKATEMEPYTIEQMAALLGAARGTRNAARWTVAMALGLRQGEVLGLGWDDLALPTGDGAEGTMVIRRQLQRVSWQHGCGEPDSCVTQAGTPATRGADCPQRWGGGLKTSEPKSEAGRRALTLPATVTAELRAHRAAQRAERLASEIWEAGPNGGWVFATEVGGPTDPRADGRDFKLLCAKAKVPPKRLHDLRHSSATMMLAEDLDLRTAGQVLGHSQLALTARYSHVLADRKSVAAARIDQALFRPKREGF